jgi:hypothetical protein
MNQETVAATAMQGGGPSDARPWVSTSIRAYTSHHQRPRRHHLSSCAGGSTVRFWATLQPSSALGSMATPRSRAQVIMSASSRMCGGEKSGGRCANTTAKDGAVARGTAIH